MSTHHTQVCSSIPFAERAERTRLEDAERRAFVEEFVTVVFPAA
ncbi:hypothetical protein [Azospirillum canadense]|nr:hypothetical protein [Azospirillum canadense]MCW2236945.1 hypothetical protein [Azospirillum canadense]